MNNVTPNLIKYKYLYFANFSKTVIFQLPIIRS